MENRRAILISAICFVISMLLISAYTKVRRAELTAEFGEELPVVVAIAPIPEYELIRPEKLAIIYVFKNYRQPQTATSIAEIAGKSAFVPIYKGEQITFTKLVTQEGKPVLDRQLEKKMRAITLGVTSFNGVSKLIRPGNRVDILASVNYESDGVLMYEIKRVLQSVLGLAIGKTIQNSVPSRVDREVMSYLEEQFELRKRKDWSGGSMENEQTSRPSDNYASLTLQLNPEDAEKLIYLSTRFGDSRLYYTLRNGADQATEPIPTTILDDVLGPDSDYGVSKRKPAPPSPPRPPRFYDSRGGVATPVD